MLQPKRALLRQYRQVAVLVSLAFSTAVCLGLLGLRVTYSHRLVYTYLAWNLFLAWLPMLCALAAYNAGKRRSRLSWLVVAGCALAWLLFFPNAPYILTDLLHLQARADAPLWFDLVLLLAFAWTGFMLGLVSLVLMQALVRRAAGAVASWAFAVAVLGLSGFGIYLGRFLRWNSWDVFFSPGACWPTCSAPAASPRRRPHHRLLWPVLAVPDLRLPDDRGPHPPAGRKHCRARRRTGRHPLGATGAAWNNGCPRSSRPSISGSQAATGNGGLRPRLTLMKKSAGWPRSAAWIGMPWTTTNGCHSSTISSTTTTGVARETGVFDLALIVYLGVLAGTLVPHRHPLAAGVIVAFGPSSRCQSTRSSCRCNVLLT